MLLSNIMRYYVRNMHNDAYFGHNALLYAKNSTAEGAFVQMWRTGLRIIERKDKQLWNR